MTGLEWLPLAMIMPVGQRKNHSLNMMARHEDESYPDIDTHKEHHEWIAERIENEAQWKEDLKELRRAVMRWLVLGFLGGAALIAYWGLLAWHAGIG